MSDELEALAAGRARGHHRHGQPDRRPPGREPRGPSRSRSPSTPSWSRPRPHHLGRRPPGLRPQAADGRLEGFADAAPARGISGFLRRVESEHDIMGAGHASTSDQLRHRARRGAAPRAPGGPRGLRDRRRRLTGGMAYEGLNQASALRAHHRAAQRQRDEHLGERGALSKLFQRVRVDPTLTKVREEIERGLAKLPGASEMGGHIRDATKSLWFVPGALFEALGFAYFGPIDGHDIGEVRKALRTTLEMDRPVMIHAKTRQGPRIRPRRGRRRGHARVTACSSSRAGRPPRVRRARRTTRTCSGRRWSPRPSGTRGSWASPPRCSRARGCST